jgi:hypothetical protein
MFRSRGASPLRKPDDKTAQRRLTAALRRLHFVAWESVEKSGAV